MKKRTILITSLFIITTLVLFIIFLNYKVLPKPIVSGGERSQLGID